MSPEERVGDGVKDGDTLEEAVLEADCEVEAVSEALRDDDDDTDGVVDTDALPLALLETEPEMLRVVDAVSDAEVEADRVTLVEVDALELDEGDALRDVLVEGVTLGVAVALSEPDTLRVVDAVRETEVEAEDVTLGEGEVLMLVEGDALRDALAESVQLSVAVALSEPVPLRVDEAVNEAEVVDEAVSEAEVVGEDDIEAVVETDRVALGEVDTLDEREGDLLCDALTEMVALGVAVTPGAMQHAGSTTEH